MAQNWETIVLIVEGTNVCAGCLPAGNTYYYSDYVEPHLCPPDEDNDSYYDYPDGGQGIHDCVDSDPNTNPGAYEVCNGEDDNCNGEVDEEAFCPGNPCTYGSCETPIILDLGKGQVSLTDVAGGVNFDINSDGTVERVAWTAAGDPAGFLVWDRDGDGAVDRQ